MAAAEQPFSIRRERQRFDAAFGRDKSAQQATRFHVPQLDRVFGERANFACERPEASVFPSREKATALIGHLSEFCHTNSGRCTFFVVAGATLDGVFTVPCCARVEAKISALAHSKNAVKMAVFRFDFMIFFDCRPASTCRALFTFNSRDAASMNSKHSGSDATTARFRVLIKRN